MSRTSLRGLAVATATVGLFAGTINAVAVAQTDTETAAAQYAPGMVAAMERDLNLSTTEAVAQIKAQEALAGTQRSLERSLGASSYAGAWVENTDELHVAVTDAADAAAVRAAGATPVAVDNTLAALDTWTADLDGALAKADVTSYHVDVETNEIVIDVVDGAEADVAAAVAEAGVPADAVSLSTAAERPRTLHQRGRRQRLLHRRLPLLGRLRGHGRLRHRGSLWFARCHHQPAERHLPGVLVPRQRLRATSTSARTTPPSARSTTTTAAP